MLAAIGTAVNDGILASRERTQISAGTTGIGVVAADDGCPDGEKDCRGTNAMHGRLAN